jgi:hypothetical protein
MPMQFSARRPVSAAPTTLIANDLELAGARVREAEANVARQGKVLTDLWRDARSTPEAENKLTVFETTLATLRDRVDELRKTQKGLDEPAG